MPLVRKNLMVDAEKLKQLASRLNLSESEAVRVAVDRLIFEDDVMTQVEQIRRRGGVRDVYGRTKPRDTTQT